jgi:microcystin-dependent protein
MFAGNFAPAGWMFCEGQLLPISENETLFQLIGTTYGGDGESTFALPNLQSRVPIHQGGGFILAETGGAEEITLTAQQIPSHTHQLLATGAAANTRNPPSNMLAVAAGTIYTSNPGRGLAVMAPQSITAVGGNQPHTNLQPYGCLNYIISLFGIFPSPT